MKTTLPEGFHLGYGYWEKGSSGLRVENGQLLHKGEYDDSNYEVVDGQKDASLIAGEISSELKRQIEPRIKELKRQLADKEAEAAHFTKALAELERLSK